MIAFAETAQNTSAGRRRERFDRLSALDISNLRVEEHGLPMNVAAIAFLESGPLLDAAGQLRLGAIRATIEARLERAPRLRQRLYTPGFAFGPPTWMDDATFDIRRHVKTRTVPHDDEASVLATCVELNEQSFDQRFPPWEIWLLTGLDGGMIAMLIRFHHVLADGMAALALLGAVFDADPASSETPAAEWTPTPPPSGHDLLAENLTRRVASVRGAWVRIRHPAPTLERLRLDVRQITRAIREGRAPQLSFNQPVGRHGRLVLVRADLERARRVAHAHHATVNDIVLAAIGGGARALLAGRGELRPDLVMKVSVAASIRVPSDEGRAGNLVGIMIAPVPVGEVDPIRRLERIARSTAEAKKLPPYQPAGPLMQRWMVRLMNRQRRVNLLASNLPGPPTPMYFAGAKVLEVFQVGVVQGNVSVAVGVLSYAGQLNFDIVGATDVVPDLDVFANGVTAELARLGATATNPTSTPMRSVAATGTG